VTVELGTRRFYRHSLQYSHHRTACPFSSVSNLMLARTPLEKRETKLDLTQCLGHHHCGCEPFELLATNDQNVNLMNEGSMFCFFNDFWFVKSNGSYSNAQCLPNLQDARWPSYGRQWPPFLNLTQQAGHRSAQCFNCELATLVSDKGEKRLVSWCVCSACAESMATSRRPLPPNLTSQPTQLLEVLPCANHAHAIAPLQRSKDLQS